MSGWHYVLAPIFVAVLWLTLALLSGVVVFRLLEIVIGPA
jgi:hypothetical protein